MLARRVDYLLGLVFDVAGMGEVVGFVEEACNRGPGIPEYMVTVNFDYVVKSLSDCAFREAVLGANMSCPDGMSIIWLMSFLGLPHKGRVSGSDILPDLMRRKLSREYTSFIFGSTEETAKAAVERINRGGGSLRAVGYVCPPFLPAEDLSDEKYIRRINDSKADILLISLNSAKAMKWIALNRKKLDVKLICPVGAAVDFLAGKPRRAPKWMQDMCLEWLWRLIHDPSLAGRYAADGAVLAYLFVRRILPYKLFLMSHRHGPDELGGLDIRTVEDGGKITVVAAGFMTERNLDKTRSILGEVLGKKADVVFDFGSLRMIDSPSLGVLTLVNASMSEMGRRASIGAESKTFRKIADYAMFNL